jgi:hypothetical protein
MPCGMILLPHGQNLAIDKLLAPRLSFITSKPPGTKQKEDVIGTNASPLTENRVQSVTPM